MTLSKELAIKYLEIYVGDADWGHHIDILWGRLIKKYSEHQAKQMLKKVIACAILLPAYDKTKVPELPENLLYWCSTYNQFEERDWVKLLEKIVNKDIQIEQWRKNAQQLGVIYPITYAPYPRQAFNWLFQSAKDAGVVNEENQEQIRARFERLVLTYGGVIICHIFQKEEGAVRRKVLNWKTNYFCERLIYEIYTEEQVLKIKAQELKKTNPDLVKKIQL
jgi:hypothetical protein